VANQSNIGIGLRIRECRIEKGMTQEELALKLGYKSKTSVNKVELGQDNLSPTRIEKFAEALGVDPLRLTKWGSSTRADADLSVDERILIENYRSADDTTREMIKRLLAYKERLLQ
jgi:repressor LexA